MSEENPAPDPLLSIPMASETDKYLTYLYLKMADKGDHFECWKPGCEYKTEDAEEMTKHIQGHIDEFLTSDWFKQRK